MPHSLDLFPNALALILQLLAHLLYAAFGEFQLISQVGSYRRLSDHSRRHRRHLLFQLFDLSVELLLVLRAVHLEHETLLFLLRLDFLADLLLELLDFRSDVHLELPVVVVVVVELLVRHNHPMLLVLVLVHFQLPRLELLVDRSDIVAVRLHGFCDFGVDLAATALRR